MREAYLDHAATTPVRPEAVAAMTEALGDPGNAASLHGAGRRARRLLEESRERVAAALGAHPVEVVVTSGGTEADNLAVKGLHWAAGRPAVATSPVEHHAVLDAVRWLGDRGARIAWCEPDPQGAVGPDAVAAALAGGDVSMVSVMWANNETGVVSPVADLAAVAAEHGVPLHTDAVQAVGHLPVDFAASGAAALSLSAHKFGGPPGVGALLLTRAVKPEPVLHGGGQERDLRSGTVPVALVVGMAVALDIAVAEREAESLRLRTLRDGLLARLRAAVPDLLLNGAAEGLPGVLSVSVPGCPGDALLMVLDGAGVRVSTGAACTSGVPEPSHVVLATTGDDRRARETVRVSLGWTTTPEDVDALVAAFPDAVGRARLAG